MNNSRILLKCSNFNVGIKLPNTKKYIGNTDTQCAVNKYYNLQ